MLWLESTIVAMFRELKEIKELLREILVELRHHGRIK